MRIREITLQEVRMKLVAPFETSMDRTEVRRILLVQADVDGVIGWAECVAGESPYYSPETADTAWLMLRDFLWPLIKGKDLEPVRRLRQDFPRIKLMVDANSAYTLNDWPLLKQLEGFYLMMIEQPLGWNDLYSHVELQKKLDTPICLDECIHTEEHARAAIE